MFETIRELAQEHLEAAGEVEAIRRRHAEHFLAVAEEAEPHLALDASQLEWIARLDGEMANLQARSSGARPHPTTPSAPRSACG